MAFQRARSGLEAAVLGPFLPSSSQAQISGVLNRMQKRVAKFRRADLPLRRADAAPAKARRWRLDVGHLVERGRMPAAGSLAALKSTAPAHELHLFNARPSLDRGAVRCFVLLQRTCQMLEKFCALPYHVFQDSTSA